MNLPDQNHPVCERLNLEKKKRIMKIKVKKCVSVTDEVLRKKKKERERERVLWNVLEFGESGREKKKRVRVRVWRRKKGKKKRNYGTCVEEKKRGKKKEKRRRKCYHNIFTINFK